MGHIRDRWKDPARRGKGRRWQVRYRVDGVEQDGGTYDVKAVAQRRLVELESAVQRGQWVDTNDQTTVTELVRAHQRTRHLRDRTAERRESMIRTHIEGSPFGERRAVAVRPSEAQAWATDRARVLAPSTLRVLVGVVRSAFAAAVADRVVGADPFARVRLPRAEAARVVPLTVAQVAEVAELAGPRYRALVLVQAACGLRLGELLALRVQDVDFLRRTVRVEHQIDRVTLDRVPPKTPRSRRTVPLPAPAADALAAYRAAHPPAAGGLIFHTSSGRPLGHWQYGGRAFGAAARKAGLPAGTSTHDLRHHFASVLLAAGQSVVAVAELLGHENATLVLTTYGHLLPGGDDLARRAIEAAWSAAAGDPGESATAQGRPE